jgi:prepilin-type N-terminal cleavage/methylation domain-containing protein
MNDKGVSLIELVVVVAVIGILVVALGFTYQGWLGRYKVESAVKDLYSDLMDARARAMDRKSLYFVDFPTTTTYRMSIDDSNGVAKPIPLNGTGGDRVFQPQTNPAVPTVTTDTTLPTFPKTFEHPVTLTGGLVGATIPPFATFDQQGLITTAASPNDAVICMFTDFDGDKKSDFDPDYDCVILSQTRIALGKLTKQNTDGGACDNANCVAK